jgi:sodium transport system permease protein
MSPTIKVFRKELREMFRDKRVRTSAFFGPIFLIVVLLLIFGSVLGGISKPQNVRVHAVKSDSPLFGLLRAKGFNVTEVETEQEGKRLVQEGKARVLVAFGPTSDGVSAVNVFFDEKAQISQIAKGAVESLFSAQNNAALESYIKANKVPDSLVKPIAVKSENIAKVQKGGASDFIVGMLPYLIVIWAFYGGMSIASDMAAGEKERNTLETLLITPVARTQIVLGKFLALSVVCLLSSLSSLVGLAAFAAVKPKGSELMFKDGLGVTPQSALLTLVLLIPLVAFFASLLIAISTYAKNTREAQTYLGLASFVVIMPAMFSQFIGLTDLGSARWINFVPILNTANNIRLALLGKPDFTAIAMTIGVSLVLALIMARITVWLFNREQVLVRT